MSMKRLIKRILYPFRVEKRNREWRKLNKHNFTTVEGLFPLEKVSVGKGTYGPLNVLGFSNKDEGLEIGNWCSIASNVVFVLGGEHNYKKFSNYPFERHLFGMDTITKGKITVQDDVWIGYGAVILSGVTIGKGSIIAAGSIISKDVMPYSIVSNNRIIKYRFSNEIIDKLMKIDFQKLDHRKITAYELADITSENVDEILENICKYNAV